MTSFLGVVIILLGVGILLLVATYLYMVQKLFSALEARHHDVWVSIGSPHLIKNNSLINNFVFLRYLLGGGFFKLQDEALSRHAKTVIYLFYFSLLVFLLWFGAYFLGRTLV